MKFNHSTQLILVALVSIMGTVSVLHSNGYLRHSSEEDALHIAEFSLMVNAPGQSQAVSAKPAQFVARCAQGYLVMDGMAKATSKLSGVVVDQKKRPVSCR